MNMRFIGATIILLATAAAPAVQAQTPREEVLRTVDRFMTALAARDTLALSAVLDREGRFTIAVMNGDSALMRSQSHAASITSLGKGSQKLLERIWDPTVTVEGPFAIVSAPYDFHQDGKFSHCGTDIFMLAREGQGWKITSASYTVRRTGCTPSPLGPPKS
jgi:hypothetical protein